MDESSCAICIKKSFCSCPKNEVEPFVCPRCQGTMCVIAFIEDSDVIRKVLKHLGLWVVTRKPFSCANVYPPLEGPTLCVPGICPPLIAQRGEAIDEFHKEHFIYNEDRDCYICPEGEALSFA